MRWLIDYFKGNRLRLAGLIVLVILWLTPQIIGSAYLMYLLTIMNIYAILAISWNFLFSYLGLLSLGHSFFMGVAGYSSALLALNYGIPPVIPIFLGPLVAVAITTLVGLPSLRLRGHFFALLSFMLTLVAAKISEATPQLGGHDGLFGIPFIYYGLTKGGDATLKRLMEYNMSFLLLVISLLLVIYVITSRAGLMLQAIRDDEVAARALGINTAKYKMYGLIVSAYIAGLSGALTVFLSGVVNPIIYGLDNASLPLVMSFIGGRGSLAGPIIGAYLIKGIEESLRIEAIVKARLFLYTLIVFLIFYFYRGGLMEAYTSIVSRLTRGGRRG